MNRTTGRWWRGVRFRITLVAVAAVTVVLAVAGVVLLQVQREQLFDSLDVTLAQRADDLESSELVRGEVPTTLANVSGDDAVVQIVDETGVIVAATANAVDGPLIGPAEIDRQQIRTADSLALEDDEYRILSRPVELAAGPGIIHVGSNTDDVRDVLAELRTALSIVVPCSALAIGALVWLLVGRTLRPVEAIRREVAAIDGTTLTHRVPTPGTGDEIDRLAHTMNDMLERHERVVRSQQQFVADASHELRTPIARMRTEIDTGSDDVVARVSEDVDHLSALVDDLLHLARADAGDHPTPRRPVDLDDIVLQEIELLRLRPGLSVDVSALSAAHLRGDAGQLRRVVRNLLDNAARHARSRVAVELREETGFVRLAVSDDGDGVPSDEADEIFERFVQLDPARSHERGGTGLGLAITRDIVERHGGTIRLDQDVPVGACFVVRLPT